MITVETDRLVLRPFTKADEEIQELVFGVEEICSRYCGKTRTLEETREWLIYRSWQSRLEDLGLWALTLKDGGQLLGLVGLQYYISHWVVWEDNPDPPFNSIEVEYSYALGLQHWGNGYVTEAGHKLIDYAFRQMRIRRIAYAVKADNTRSVNVMRRLGFALQKNLHADGKKDVVGVLYNTLLDRVDEPKASQQLS